MPGGLLQAMADAGARVSTVATVAEALAILAQGYRCSSGRVASQQQPHIF